MTSRRILSVFYMVYGLLVPWCAAQSYSGIVAFGDSLSDVGNVYHTVLTAYPASPPYDAGRFSNGPVWVEDMAVDQGLTVPTRSGAGGADWAYGGTTTGTGNTTYTYLFFRFNFPNLQTQIGSFLNSNGNSASASKLYVMWDGANDFINGQTNASVPVGNIATSITTLANAGAKTFLVPNLPPLGETPEFRGTSSQTAMDNLSTQFNTQLATTLTNLQSSLNVTIYQLDAYGMFENILSNPSAYGFTDVTDQALVNNTVVPNPNQYLFWDDIHPTQVGHSLLGAAASDLLDTHNWIASAASASWASTTSWNPSAAPQSRWITNVINSTSPGTREAVVSANSSVRSVNVSGTSGLMSLRIESGAALSASQSVTASSGGQIKLNGGQISTPLVHLTGSASLVGSGTIAGNLSQDNGSSIGLSLNGPGAGQYDRIAVTGAATLAGAINISLGGGYISLPGSSYEILDFASRNGDPAIVNQTGYAGLGFVKSFTSNALTLTATAIPGDANLDGHIDVQDLFQLALHWQSSGNWLNGDFDHNGVVNLTDLSLLASDWNTSAASLSADLTMLGLPNVPTSSVPEPNLLVAISGIALLGRRTGRRGNR